MPSTPPVSISNIVYDSFFVRSHSFIHSITSCWGFGFFSLVAVRGRRAEIDRPGGGCVNGATQFNSSVAVLVKGSLRGSGDEVGDRKTALQVIRCL